MFNSYPTIWVYLNKSLNIAYLMSLHLFKNGSSLFSIKLMSTKKKKKKTHSLAEDRG